MTTPIPSISVPVPVKQSTPSASEGSGNGAILPLLDPAGPIKSIELATILEVVIRTRREELQTLEAAYRVLLDTPAAFAPSAMPAGAAGAGAEAAAPGNGKPWPSSTSTSLRPMTISETVVDLLRASGPLHIAEIQKRLAARYHRKTTTKNLVNTLNRWVHRGKIFIRTGPNTFGLIAAGQARRRA